MLPTELEIKERIRQFLRRHVRTSEFNDEVDVFGSGIVNSLFALQLVLFIEKQFGITVEGDDLKLHNFSSVNAMTSFVRSKLLIEPAP